MAYKVYAGTTKLNRDYTTINGNSYYNNWDWVTKQLIFTTTPTMDYDQPLILDPELNLSKNTINEFTFTVPKLLQDPGTPSGEHKNPAYDSIAERKTVIAVYEDDVLYWVGYVKEVTLNFDLSKVVRVVDLLDFLKQDMFRMSPMTWYVTDADFNSMWTAFTQPLHVQDKNIELNPPNFQRGTVTIQTGTTIDTSDKGSIMDTCWNGINTYWLNEYDGYLRLRYAEVGNTIIVFLDYLRDIPDKTSQTVEYGKNMLDFEYAREIPDDLVNYVEGTRIATSTSGWWIFKNTSTNFYSGHAQDDASIRKYGRHAKIIVSSTATSDAGISEECRKELATYKQDIEPTVTVKAFDLCDAGVSTDHLGFLKKTRIVSAPHGIDEWMVCTKAVIPLDKPDQKEFTFGRPPEKLTAQKNILEAVAEQIGLSVRGLVSYAQGKG